MAYTCRPHLVREAYHRYHARDDPANKLDPSKPLLSCSTLPLFTSASFDRKLISRQLSYLMFHWVTGMPFDSELHGGAYDDLTLWEQIDDGAQYTPAKKWLLSVPIML